MGERIADGEKIVSDLVWCRVKENYREFLLSEKKFEYEFSGHN